MAVYPPSKSCLKSGDTVIIRSAEVSDAATLIALMNHGFSTSAFLVHEPDEFTRTARQQRALIRHATERPELLCLVAEHNRKLIGCLDTQGDPRRRARHCVKLGLVIHETWRSQGVGRRLLETLIEWAAASTIVGRLELQVHANNRAGLALYQALGFEIEGRRKHAIRLNDDTYIDDIMMAKLFPSSRRSSD
ncbi:MAG: N-acetyltransferase [Pseudomonadota bacterium]